MEIKRVDLAELSEDEFIKDFFEPEIPLILTGIAKGMRSTTRELTILLGEILTDTRTITNKTWFQTDGDYFQEKMAMPTIVGAALDATRSYKRLKNLRIWVNRQGHETPFHADVNGLFVFNFQVSGKKRWQILHPDTEITKHAFTQIAARKYNRNVPIHMRSSFMEFDLDEDEMLFLPPYWYHRVISIDRFNLNVNWVGTKKHARPNRLSIRESEIMKALLPASHFYPLRKMVDLLVGSKEENYFVNYAGNGGIDFIQSRIAGISSHRAAGRVCREIAMLPLLIWEWRTIRSYQPDPTKVLREFNFSERLERL